MKALSKLAMKSMLSNPKLQNFVVPNANEEILVQPLYHFQAYGTSGATSFSFFGTTLQSATSQKADTNMEKASSMSAGKRMIVTGISVIFIAGVESFLSGTVARTETYGLDARKVLEGLGYAEITIMQKPYLTIAPLTYLSAGMGMSGHGAVSSLSTLVDTIDYVSNGVPHPEAHRKLDIPLFLPSEVAFDVTIYFKSAITITTAGRLGVMLHGLQIRPRQ